METLLTARQLQERLQVDRITIYRMIANGRLKGVKVGGQWRFREEDVKELVAGGHGHSNEQTSRKPATLPMASLEAVQRLFGTVAGVTVLIVDAQGEPLTGIVNPSAFCTLLQASETGRARCVASWLAMVREPGRTPRLFRCHAGLLYACTAIRVDGEQPAMFIAGQVLTDTDPNEMAPERAEELGQACGIPSPALQKAYAVIQRLDYARRNELLDLLRLLGATASRITGEHRRLITKLQRIAQIAMEN